MPFSLPRLKIITWTQLYKSTIYLMPEYGWWFKTNAQLNQFELFSVCEVDLKRKSKIKVMPPCYYKNNENNITLVFE